MTSILHTMATRATRSPGSLRVFGCVTVLGVIASLHPIMSAQENARVQLMTLDPGHFHAALFQKEMLPEISDRVHVYGPLGPDLLAHLNRISQFNSRRENPTRWQMEVHAGPRSLERLLAERPGNVVVLSGNNRGKIQKLNDLVRHGLHVLADKPWIIEPQELPQLQAALAGAAERGVVAYDAMTQRYEVSCILPRELAQDPEVFGDVVDGSSSEPAVRMESVHYFLKEVAGVASLRPPWFFDVRQQGEGLADVGTHLVDLVQWTLFPDQTIDYRKEVAVLQGSHWPTVLSQAQFRRVTGEAAFPDCVQESVRNNALECFANNSVLYRLRGVFVRLDIRWDFEPTPGAKDSEYAVFRGTRSRIEVRQGPEEQFVPQVDVIPATSELKPAVQSALLRRMEKLQASMPGLAVRDLGERLRIVIPDRYRVGHEAHFGLLTHRFLDFVRQPRTMPTWEAPNLLAKYFVTTEGVRLARNNPRKEAL